MSFAATGMIATRLPLALVWSEPLVGWDTCSLGLLHAW
jgi:hypothetical protein